MTIQTRSRRWLVLGLAFAAALAAATVGVATGAIDDGGSPPALPPAMKTVSQASDASAQARAAFAIVARPQSAADTLPAELAASLQRSMLTETYGMNPALARRASTDAGAIWVVPGNDSTCLVVEMAASTPSGHAQGGAACATVAQAAEGTLTLSGSVGPQAQSDPEAFIAGVVPDGIGQVQVELSDGSERTLAVHDNVYGTALDGPTAKTVTYRGPTGTTTVHP